MEFRLLELRGLCPRHSLRNRHSREGGAPGSAMAGIHFPRRPLESPLAKNYTASNRLLMELMLARVP